ncbi:MAG: hypothetical protein ABL983_00080 [Nitrospira sp.]
MNAIWVIERPRIRTGLFKGPREFQATHGGWILYRAPTKRALKQILNDRGILSVDAEGPRGTIFTHGS